LGENEILAGSEIAGTLKLSEGGSIQIKDRPFKVLAILPVTGTVDDNRLFTHLRTVQTLSGKNGALNAIEIVGCCSEISKGLIQKINKLLPDAKVVTITQIVQTQLNTNNLMNKLSLIMLIIIIIIGGASIANYMFANVYERRREIGILMAMGAKPAWLVKLFLLKSLYIGLAGGVIGYILGTLLAVFLGPQLAGIAVLPLPALGLYGLGISLLISVFASILPVMKAVKIDPSVIMQEE
jgi:putative ABC transport system permease protein